MAPFDEGGFGANAVLIDMDDVGLVDVDEPRWGFSFADDTVDFGRAVAEGTFDGFAAGFRMLGMIKRSNV